MQKLSDLSDYIQNQDVKHNKQLSWESLGDNFFFSQKLTLR